MFLHGLARFLMAGGLLVAAAGWWMKHELPDPAKLRLEALDEPVQKSVRKPPIGSPNRAWRTTQSAGLAALLLGLVLWLFLPARLDG